MSEYDPYNPLDKQNLGISIRDALLARPVHPLGDLSAFPGAGLYALYYTGDFPAYERLAKLNRDGQFRIPIYVGMADKATRKGATKAAQRQLYDRLRKHAESIKAVSNLLLKDFYCRFLVVDEIWIPLGETLLISKFSPVWNGLVDGFGNHDPGAGRYEGLCPRWDTLHPGRKWAEKCKKRQETAEQIETEIANFLSSL